jgi:rSAM/selenodomain-associated transferase 1
MEFSRQTVMRKPDRTLVIMAKAPRPGLVKTRLMQSLPQPAVTAFYRCLLDDTMALARSLGTVDLAIMCPGPDAEELARLAGEGVRVVAQKGEGLAAGLTSVFRQFAIADRRVIAFNSDSPHLPASVLAGGFETLISHDMVVGPTHDGGYYLVGAKAAYPTLFECDGMGTTNALQSLLARVSALQLSVGFTEPFYDIDVAADLMRLAGELKLAPEKAPRTAAWLKEWGHAIAQLRTGTEDL